MKYPSFLRVDPKGFDLGSIDPRDKRGPDGRELDRDRAAALHEENMGALKELQYKMWAEDQRSVLVVLQALDTGGKDGAIRNTFGLLNPQGVKTHAFKRPTDEELEHDYLWRVHAHTPRDGHIGVFNRSYYEDVLVVRVHSYVPEERWRKRYRHIREFERLLVDEGTAVVKIMLHISKDEQKERLQQRLDDPTRHWKFDKGDLAERKHWDAYMAAFQDALVETSTDYAPWYVIPADRKWFRNFAISSIMRELLESMELRWPEPQEGLDEVVID